MAKPTDQKTPPAPETDPLRVEAADDGLSAWVEGRAGLGLEPAAAQAMLTNLLRQNGICFGLVAPALKQVLQRVLEGERVERTVIAKGAEPQPGKDAEIQVVAPGPALRMKPSGQMGTLNFTALQEDDRVRIGQSLARLVPESHGKPGRDVFGMKLEAPPVRVLKLRGGRGVAVSADGLEATAMAAGVAHRPQEELFEVLDFREIAGDVGVETGDVDYPGILRVLGAVRSGRRVRAVFLQVNATENQTSLEVEQDLVVIGGLVGSEVKVGGDLLARYVRGAQVVCGGNALVYNEIMTSRMRMGGRLVMRSHEARVVNSHLEAVGGMNLGEVLSSSAGATLLVFGMRAEFEQRLASLRRALVNLEAERTNLQEAIHGQAQQLSGTEDDLREILKEIQAGPPEHQRETLMAQVRMIQPMRDALREGITSGRNKITELSHHIQRTADQVEMMTRRLPTEAVWLDIRDQAEISVEIRASKSALELDQALKRVSLRELPVSEGGRKVFRIQVSPLREEAKI